MTKPTIDELKKRGSLEIFDDVEAQTLLKKRSLSAIEVGKKFEATGVIGFGGGSSMDVAKLVSLISGLK